MKDKSTKSELAISRSVKITIHVICWIILFCIPLSFTELDDNGKILWGEYFARLIVPISYMIMFYVNYFVLVPKFIVSTDGKKPKIFQFVFRNVLLMIFMTSIIYVWINNEEFRQFIRIDSIKDKLSGIGADDVVEDRKFIIPQKTVGVIRNIIFFIICVFLSILIRISERYNKVIEQMREIENNKIESELKLLKNQLNPHFLLNTLNNIYALIGMDTEKARLSVENLGILLRYLLYDNKEMYVPLYKEIKFIKNYIALMKIRLYDNVNIIETYDIHDDNVLIAPQIFISIIENAFKHGISLDYDSFINISIKQPEDGMSITCNVTNSYFPKNNYDKSGSGIGFELVKKRLELMYTDHYDFEYKISDDKKTFVTILTINI